MTEPLPQSHVDLLCLAQHHGLPTRLLDWSCSLPVALAFACMNDQYRGTDGVLWALNVNRLNARYVDGSGRLPAMNKDVMELAGKARRGLRESRPMIAAFEPVMRFPRMVSQHSFFTIHGDRSALEKLEGADQFLRPYLIPASAKSVLHGLLRNSFGARREVLFPDLSTLGDELAGQRYSDSPIDTPGPPLDHPIESQMQD
jgi:hypothetical protein